MYSITKRSYFDKILLALLPLMAVCKTLTDALTAAVIAAVALLLTDLCAHFLRKLISGAPFRFARIIISIGFIGAFAAVVSLFAKTQIENLGVYLYIPAVTALFFGESEGISFFGRIKASAINSLAFFTLLTVSGFFRELIGMGSVCGIDLYTKWFVPIGFFTTPAGGLLTAAVLLIVCRAVFDRTEKEAKDE